MIGLAEQLDLARTALFVPGNRPERFPKASASGAHLVVLDLEDAVPAAEKQAARDHVARWLAEGNTCAVRVNAAGTRWYAEDVAAVSAHECVVLVPKAEQPEALRDLAASLATSSRLLALVETAHGVLRAPEIAAVDGVARLVFGSFDLAAQLGVSPDDRLAMAPARGALVLASAAAGIAPPMDGVTAAVDDLARVRDDAEHGRRLGFSGKLCIHPRQVSTVDEAMRPEDAEIAWATSILESAGDDGVSVVNGQMIDPPVVERARRILRSGSEVTIR